MHEEDPQPGGLHHVELWVPDLTTAVAEWGWLLGELGYAVFQDWPQGRSWRLGPTYVVVERSPAMTATAHERLPGDRERVLFRQLGLTGTGVRQFRR